MGVTWRSFWILGTP